MSREDVRFKLAVPNGVWGFSVRYDREDLPVPSPRPSNRRFITFDIIEAQKPTDNKDGALAAFASQASTPEELTTYRRTRFQAWRKTRDKQCTNPARTGEISCGMEARRASVKDQLIPTPHLPCSRRLNSSATVNNSFKSKNPIPSSKSIWKA